MSCMRNIMILEEKMFNMLTIDTWLLKKGCKISHHSKGGRIPNLTPGHLWSNNLLTREFRVKFLMSLQS